jgi:hypothetical protein
MTYPPQQPGPYGQPDPYGQQPPWTAPGAYPVGPPPRKPRTGLIASLIIVGILVLGGGGVGLYFLTKGSVESGAPGPGPAGGDDPRAVAERFADFVERGANSDGEDVDPAELEPIVCAEDYRTAEKEIKRDQQRRATSTRKPTKRAGTDRYEATVSDVKVEGDRGTFAVSLRRGDDKPQDRTFDLLRSGGNWQVCGLYKDDEQTRPTTSRRQLPLPTRPTR